LLLCPLVYNLRVRYPFPTRRSSDLYLPDQLILYRNADFRQRIVVNMHPQASLFLTDIITPGWSPDGEKFQYKQAHLLNEVHMDRSEEHTSETPVTFRSRMPSSA